MAFIRFMTSIWGRLLRMALGMILPFIGLIPVGGWLGWVLVVFGLVLVLAATFNFCLLAPLFGAPLRAGDDDV